MRWTRCRKAALWKLARARKLKADVSGLPIPGVECRRKPLQEFSNHFSLPKESSVVDSAFPHLTASSRATKARYWWLASPAKVLVLKSACRSAKKTTGLSRPLIHHPKAGKERRAGN